MLYIKTESKKIIHLKSNGDSGKYCMEGHLNNTVAHNKGRNKIVNGSHLLLRFIKYWPLFVLTLVLSISAALLYLQYSVPVYESKASILIKDDKKGVDDSRLLSSFDLFSANKIVENEIEVLRSRAVMKEVVNKLGLYAIVKNEGSFHDVNAYTQSPVTVQVKDPGHLKESEKIYFYYDEHLKAVVAADKTYPLNIWINSPWGIIRFLPNDHFISRQSKEKFFLLFSDVRKVTDDLLSNLDVSSVGKISTMVNLTLKDQAPERGEAILNAVIEEYNHAAIEDKNSSAAHALSFVEERLRYVLAELDSVETAIQKYKSTRGVVDISEQGKVFLQSVENNDQKISQINVQLAVLDQIDKYITTQDGNPGIIPSTVGLNDEILSQLLSKLYEAEIQYERLKRTTAENNPILISLQNQIDKIKPSIIENIRNQRNNLLASKGNLSGTSDRYSSLLRSIPQKERQLLDITRQQSIKNNIYTFLLQKREEAALAFTASVADSRVIDKAQSGLYPVSPGKIKILAIALLLGLSIPIGLISIKEIFNETIRSKADIESLSTFPVLGEINYSSSRNPFILRDDETSYISEQIRQIRTSLSYLGIQQGVHTLLVTSAAQGEGKTFVAINLALSLALTDKKVVIVELDLRKPGLKQIFNQNTNLGMSDYLKGKASFEQILYQTTVNNQLYLIPAGAVPSYPSELISNGKMPALLDYLQSKFDYVIIETAPVGPVTDAYIVSKLCNATLFVVRQDKTLKEDIQQLQDNKKIRDLGNVAILFNGVKPLGFNNRNYKYIYGKAKA